MMTLQGEQVFLRALEPEDIDFIYAVENNESVWDLSNTLVPFSRYILKDYLANAHKDIFEVKQLRLVISNYNKVSLGFIDLFDFDPSHRRAGIGILILEAANRQKGYGTEALKLLINYATKHLYLHQLYCNISEDNQASLQLFKKQGFEIVGLKKDWNFVDGAYKNEYLLQRITQ